MFFRNVTAEGLTNLVIALAENLSQEEAIPLIRLFYERSEKEVREQVLRELRDRMREGEFCDLARDAAKLALIRYSPSGKIQSETELIHELHRPSFPALLLLLARCNSSVGHGNGAVEEMNLTLRHGNADASRLQIRRMGLTFDVEGSLFESVPAIFHREFNSDRLD